jgi:hypothetical protein
MLNDTLLGFSTLAETATENSLVVWINEYFGPVASDCRVSIAQVVGYARLTRYFQREWIKRNAPLH